MIAILASKRINNICRSIFSTQSIICNNITNKSNDFIDSLNLSEIKYLIIELYLELLNEVDEKIIKLCRSKHKNKIIILTPDSLAGELLLSEKDKKGLKCIIRISENDACKTIKQALTNLLSLEAVSDIADQLKERCEPTRKIMFLNVSNGAGSTLLSAGYANYLASSNLKICLLEFPLNVSIYQQISVYKISGTEKKHNEFPTMLIKEGYQKRGNSNQIYLKYVVSNPNEKRVRNWNVYDMLKLLEIDNSCDQLIIDVGSYWKHPSIMKTLPMIDYIFVVFDASNIHSKEIKESLEYFIKYRAHSKRISFVFNKYHEEQNSILKRAFEELKPVIKIRRINDADQIASRGNFTLDYYEQLEESYLSMFSKVYKELYKDSFYKQNNIFKGEI